MILQDDAWVVVDRAFNDVPVAAWADFDTHARCALHEPVPCRIRLFHANGGMVLKRVLEAMDAQLLTWLDEAVASHKVLKFPDKRD